MILYCFIIIVVVDLVHHLILHHVELVSFYSCSWTSYWHSLTSSYFSWKLQGDLMALKIILKFTFSRMSIWTVKFWTFFLESASLMDIKTVITITTVGEILALNMLKRLKSQIEWVSLFFKNFAFGNVGLFSNFNLFFLL